MIANSFQNKIIYKKIEQEKSKIKSGALKNIKEKLKREFYNILNSN